MRYRVALGDGVGGDECETAMPSCEIGQRFRVPAGDVVEAADVVLAPRSAQLLCLCVGAGRVTEERRVVGDDSVGCGWTDRSLVEGESIPASDSGLLLDGQSVQG